ncbi:hypothetical protein K505DRAFT_154733 [Melanomma pulvis-pyrius CBS 109.77]|uniref:Uncharacterized protein n=1 Tax=Melanomma pulvis-pyrius CBS 109.77 TaxID=1314802 RepID=A0A6A6WQ81_9PLEO|nr:hypothetical protein K505DRAFT_154733 [Melanomma pulvis-pyrius CBS 109.77]
MGSCMGSSLGTRRTSPRQPPRPAFHPAAHRYTSRAAPCWRRRLAPTNERIFRSKSSCLTCSPIHSAYVTPLPQSWISESVNQSKGQSRQSVTQPNAALSVTHRDNHKQGRYI